MKHPPCGACGRDDADRIQCVDADGVEIMAGFLCDPCFDVALKGAAERRVEFDALIAAGVDRKAANDIMIGRINAEPKS